MVVFNKKMAVQSLFLVLVILITGRSTSAPASNFSLLSAADRQVYQEIFSVQDRGEWNSADKLLKKLSDPRLKGYVLYQRYMHPTKYRAEYPELKRWMDRYADLPVAEKIYSLALKRRPKSDSQALQAPATGKRLRGRLETLGWYFKPYVSPRNRDPAAKKKVASFERHIIKIIASGRPSAALEELQGNGKSILDSVEYDRLLGRVAAGYFYEGLNVQAIKYSAQSVRRSGKKAPFSLWIAGLSHWKAEKIARAGGYFEQLADSPYVSAWASAGGAFWAARARLRAGEYSKVSELLRKAARHQRTFYGLLATKILGADVDFNWGFSQGASASLKNNKRLSRAIALSEAGQNDWAGKELRFVNPGKDQAAKDALVFLAVEKGFPALAMRLGNAVSNKDGQLYDSALYPEIPWSIPKEYSIDKALLHAFIRQESKFSVTAGNRSGATGLMQIMPRTANHVMETKIYTQDGGRDLLRKPKTNIKVGTKYLSQLLERNSVQNNLFYLMIAYNAGPTKLYRWKKKLTSIEDPLLFIESIPSSETRDFVEKIMTNFWIYRQKFGQKTPSLDYVASGQWPIYLHMDRD